MDSKFEKVSQIHKQPTKVEYTMVNRLENRQKPLKMDSYKRISMRSKNKGNTCVGTILKVNKKRCVKKNFSFMQHW